VFHRLDEDMTAAAGDEAETRTSTASLFSYSFTVTLLAGSYYKNLNIDIF